MNETKKMNIDNGKIELFLASLQKAKKENLVKTLVRGFDLDFVYKVYGLNVKFNNIKQFGEKLFYFGEKSKYFWNERIGSSSSPFEINEVSDTAFEYIFDSFCSLIQDCKEGQVKKYFEKNKNTTQFFLESKNKDVFIQKINTISSEAKLTQRNYYLRILHQLGATPYKDSSLLVSSSTKEGVAKRFSHKGITIYFWDWTFSNQDRVNRELPYFIGKPYKNQKEISVFAGIFPHYIYAFKYKKKMYYNPAVNNVSCFDTVVCCGFEIDQTDFKQRLEKETNLKSHAEKKGNEYKEIK